MENRFSTMTEVRNVLWPEYEKPEWSAAQFLQGIAGTLELFHRSTLSFQKIAGEVTEHPVAVFQRIDKSLALGRLIGLISEWLVRSSARPIPSSRRTSAADCRIATTGPRRAIPHRTVAQNCSETRGPGLVPMRDLEANVIRNAMQEYSGNVSQVSRRLGISRSTIYRKMREFGMNREIRIS